MTRFPFVISKRRSVVVEADTLANALDRVLYKHPNKFIKTNYARNVAKHLKTMDLINAHKVAKEKSKAEKKTQYFVILENDEFEVKRFDAVKPKDDVYSVWRDGVKVDSPKEDKPEPAEKKVVTEVNRQLTKTAKGAAPKQAVAERKWAKKRLPKQIIEEAEVIENNSKQNKMEKVKKAKPAKKATKKVAKKSTAKKAAKKNGIARVAKSPRKFEAGKIVSISIADMIKNTKKGYVYRDPQGVIQTVKYMETRAKQDYVRDGMHEYKVAK